MTENSQETFFWILINSCTLLVSNSEQTYERLVGTFEWNTNGYIDVIFPAPISDTKCPDDASCTKHSYFASKCQIMFYLSAFIVRFSKRLYTVTSVISQPTDSANFKTAFDYLPPLLQKCSHIVSSAKHRDLGVKHLVLHHTVQRALLNEDRATFSRAIWSPLGEMPFAGTFRPPWRLMKWLKFLYW
jgi:hypothetical protein